MIYKIEIRLFKYETEREEAINDILKFFGYDFKKVEVEGFFKDKIYIYTFETKDKNKINDLVNKIFNNLEENTKYIIKNYLLDFVDDKLRLHLKFDKQYFYVYKKFKLLDQGDLIKIIIHFKKSKDLNKDIENIIRYIHQLIQ